jgi:hypothetical protein
LIATSPSPIKMSVQGMRVVPMRTFDIWARAVVVVTAMSEADRTVIRTVVSADHRAKVNPAKDQALGDPCAEALAREAGGSPGS